jgi:hypothetical protein
VSSDRKISPKTRVDFTRRHVNNSFQRELYASHAFAVLPLHMQSLSRMTFISLSGCNVGRAAKPSLLHLELLDYSLRIYKLPPKMHTANSLRPTVTQIHDLSIIKIISFPAQLYSRSILLPSDMAPPHSHHPLLRTQNQIRKPLNHIIPFYFPSSCSITPRTRSLQPIWIGAFASVRAMVSTRPT